MSVKICFMYLGDPMLGTYICTVVISSCWIDPSIIIYCPFLSLITVFVLKSVLSDIILLPQLFFSFHLHRIPFPFPHFQATDVFRAVVPLVGNIHMSLVFAFILSLHVF